MNRLKPKTPSAAASRNQRVYRLLASLINNAKLQKNTLVASAPFRQAHVEALFAESIWGHRELVLTILMARMIDPHYRATVDLYACNPRALFEGPIRQVLHENNIPHRKSGPLNIAKNIKKINEDWAANKDGGKIARCTVAIVNAIEAASSSELQNFALVFAQKYLHEAKRVAHKEVKIERTADALSLHELCSALIINVPDGGATPQIIVGMLLAASIDENQSRTKLSDFMESVFATNTTSKKPGDLTETLPDGSEKVYEVTVKKFTRDRTMDSHEAVRIYDEEGRITEVTVICRDEDAPEDVRGQLESSYVIGVLRHESLTYIFVEIFEWIFSRLQALSPNTRKKFHADLAAYVNLPNTSEKVKDFFRLWHEQHA